MVQSAHACVKKSRVEVEKLLKLIAWACELRSCIKAGERVQNKSKNECGG